GVASARSIELLLEGFDILRAHAPGERKDLREHARKPGSRGQRTAEELQRAESDFDATFVVLVVDAAEETAMQESQLLLIRLCERGTFSERLGEGVCALAAAALVAAHRQEQALGQHQRRIEALLGRNAAIFKVDLEQRNRPLVGDGGAGAARAFEIQP